VVFATEQVTKTSACYNIIVILFSTSSYQQKLVTLQKLLGLGLSQTVWPQSKSCRPNCYFEILMRIQRNLGSAAVNVFDTKIEMPLLHESVSRSVAAKYIRMMFRIQKAENKPRLSRRIFVKPPPPKNFRLSRK